MRRFCLFAASCAVGISASIAVAQIGTDRLNELREQGVLEDWTFTVGENSATVRAPTELCGLVPPSEPDLSAPLAPNPTLRGDLPVAFDWRAETGCPPVRDQGGCGSCWSFATVGALECNILIRDDDTVDLSEQWLVSCNQSGYSCWGGWWAHHYHHGSPDACGGTGAVLEADYPYVAADVQCGCPYPHAYVLEGWGYVAGSNRVPAVEELKQAIYDYGPVAVAVYAGDAFTAYTGGIFNADADYTVNHGVVLVGWDDNSGNGYWILRNSWGTGWGEGGYMRIAYGCSRVGFGASYVYYSGSSDALLEVTPTPVSFGDVDVATPQTRDLTVKNVGTEALSGSAEGLEFPFSIVGDVTYDLDPGESRTLTVRCAPELLGAYSSSLSFSGGNGASVSVTAVAVGSGVPADHCAYAPVVADGSLSASNVNAQTDDSAGCGGGGNNDLWWRFVPEHSGVVTLDTDDSDFDTVLTVFDYCGGNEIACNDDIDGRVSSRVSFGVLDGSSYLVRVAGVAGQTGTVTLSIETDPRDLWVTGRVTDARGVPLEGVTFTGLPGDPQSDHDGNFVASVAYGFTGTVRPAKSGWTFEPAEVTFAALTMDNDGTYFVAVPVELIVSGRVTDERGHGVSGVTLDGFAQNVVTDASGVYATVVPHEFSGTIVPRRDGFVFTPGGRTYATLISDEPGQNFVATQQFGTLRVRLSPEAPTEDGARWRVAGGQWQASGATVDGLPTGPTIVEYADVTGYASPAREFVTIRANQVLDVERVYVAAGCLLEVEVDPPTAGSVTIDPAPRSDGTYADGTVVTLTATAAAGYEFAEWEGVAGLVPSGATLRVELQFDTHLTAGFLKTGAAELADETDVVGPLLTSGPMLCGGGVATVVPLTLLACVGLRRSRFGPGGLGVGRLNCRSNTAGRSFGS